MLSASNVDTVVRATLNESVGLALDNVFFSASAATTAAPAGLRNGVSAGTASASTSSTEALYEDVQTLVAAVAGVAGNGPIALVAHPAQAQALKLRLEDGSNVYGSAALSAGVVMAVAPRAVVVVIDP